MNIRHKQLPLPFKQEKESLNLKANDQSSLIENTPRSIVSSRLVSKASLEPMGRTVGGPQQNLFRLQGKHQYNKQNRQQNSKQSIEDTRDDGVGDKKYPYLEFIKRKDEYDSNSYDDTEIILPSQQKLLQQQQQLLLQYQLGISERNLTSLQGFILNKSGGFTKQFGKVGSSSPNILDPIIVSTGQQTNISQLQPREDFATRAKRVKNIKMLADKSQPLQLAFDYANNMYILDHRQDDCLPNLVNQLNMQLCSNQLNSNKMNTSKLSNLQTFYPQNNNNQNQNSMRQTSGESGMNMSKSRSMNDLKITSQFDKYKKNKQVIPLVDTRRSIIKFSNNRFQPMQSPMKPKADLSSCVSQFPLVSLMNSNIISPKSNNNMTPKNLLISSKLSSHFQFPPFNKEELKMSINQQRFVEDAQTNVLTTNQNIFHTENNNNIINATEPSLNQMQILDKLNTQSDNQSEMYLEQSEQIKIAQKTQLKKSSIRSIENDHSSIQSQILSQQLHTSPRERTNESITPPPTQRTVTFIDQFIPDHYHSSQTSGNFGQGGSANGSAQNQSNLSQNEQQLKQQKQQQDQRTPFQQYQHFHNIPNETNQQNQAIKIKPKQNKKFMTTKQNSKSNNGSPRLTNLMQLVSNVDLSQLAGIGIQKLTEQAGLKYPSAQSIVTNKNTKSYQNRIQEEEEHVTKDEEQMRLDSPQFSMRSNDLIPQQQEQQFLSDDDEQLLKQEAYQQLKQQLLSKNVRDNFSFGQKQDFQGMISNSNTNTILSNEKVVGFASRDNKNDDDEDLNHYIISSLNRSFRS